MAETEEQLVERARDGDQAALGEVLERHRNRLFNVALRMVGHRDDALETTQEAMLKICKHIGGYDGRSKLTTWMIRITMNQAISLLRKRRLRKTASLESEGYGDASSDGSSGYGESGGMLRSRIAADGEPNAHACVERDEMLTVLHNAMDRLDDDFRAVLVLRDINEMDYRQMADVLSVPVGTVKSRLFRARLALRQEMAKTYPELREDGGDKSDRGDARGGTGGGAKDVTGGGSKSESLPLEGEVRRG